MTELIIFLQGINYCKQLGIKPSTTISAKDFDKIWKKYDDSKTGFLDKKAARKFLKVQYIISLPFFVFTVLAFCRSCWYTIR